MIISLPAFQKTRGEIMRPGFHPPRNDIGGKKLTVFYLGFGELERPFMFSPVKPDEFLARPVGRREPDDPGQHRSHPKLFFELASGRFVILFPGLYMARCAGIPEQRMAVLPARPFLQEKL